MVGTLPRSLATAGYQPKQIRDVLLTHIHINHSGGLMNGHSLTFPNALVHVAKREADYWLNPQNFIKASASAKARALEAQQKVGPVKKRADCACSRVNVQLFPGIRALAASGHTPGHTVYVLGSRSQKLMFWGDMMHIAVVQFSDPGMAIVYDADAKKAAATRKSSCVMQLPRATGSPSITSRFPASVIFAHRERAIAGRRSTTAATERGNEPRF